MAHVTKPMEIWQQLIVICYVVFEQPCHSLLQLREAAAHKTFSSTLSLANFKSVAVFLRPRISAGVCRVQ